MMAATIKRYQFFACLLRGLKKKDPLYTPRWGGHLSGGAVVKSSNTISLKLDWISIAGAGRAQRQ